MRRILRPGLVFFCPLYLAAGDNDFRFHVRERGEVVAEIEMTAPGSDWGVPGREAAMAILTLDRSARQHVVLFAGPERHPYSVFLGSLAAGEHRLRIERDPANSAPGAGLQVAAARFRCYRPRDPDFSAIAHAPVLYAREDSIGRFTDVPMLVYCERLEENGRPLLQYTVIFSNEDGGTSTRALMARWGRATDIEYVYKVYLPGPRAVIQTRDHKEVAFRGAREGSHPLLSVATRNNMVVDDGRSAVRYQLAPVIVSLENHSRERVMDEHPATYRVMARELAREAKLRPFGVVDGEKISDPRNYLYVEAKVSNQDTALAVLVRLEGEATWRSSNLGRTDYAISRSGWFRTAVELPPGTKPSAIEDLGFQCLLSPVERNGKRIWPDSGACRLEAVGRVFFLDAEFRPGPDIWAPDRETRGLTIAAGEIRTFRPRSR